jgi:hypothetical protein
MFDAARRTYIGPSVQELSQMAHARATGQAALISANAQATPSLQPGSMSGTYFTPEQQAMGQKLFDTQLGLLDKFTGYLDNWQPLGGGPGMGAPGGGGDFASYFNNVTGAMPDVNFRNLSEEMFSPAMTPQQLLEQTNTLWADPQARAGNTALGLFQARPGMAPRNVDHNARMLEAATRAAQFREFNRVVPGLAEQGRNQVLNAYATQNNIDNSRLNAMLQQGQLAAGVRGQDIQNQLGQGRLAVDDRGNFLRALSGFGSGFGGGFGGFLQPLQFSQSGPAGYIFPSDQYQPVKPLSGRMS